MLPLNVMDLLKRNRSSRGVAANHYLTKGVFGKVAPDQEKGLWCSVQLLRRWQHREAVASHVKSSGISRFDLKNSEIARWNAENVGANIVRAFATESEQLRETTVN
jgi:hypothetical protein